MVGIAHKIGIIGFGGMGRFHHSCLVDNGFQRATVKGVFDIDPEALKVAAERGLQTFSSKEELFADPEIDLVTVATSNEVHPSLSIEAMRAGKNVLCEKPVTLSSAELLEVMEVSRETRKVFTINHNRRTNPDLISVQRRIAEGLLGKPYLLESRVEGSRGIPKGWRTLKALGGGMMYDWGVHLIDQVLTVAKGKVTEVYCKLHHIHYHEVDDGFHLMLTFDDGLQVIIEVGTNSFISHPRWLVYGTDGSLAINNFAHGGTIVHCIDRENKWDDEIVLTSAGPSKTMAPRSERSIETVEFDFPTDVVDNLTVVYNQYIDAVEGKAELTIRPEQALRVLRIIEAAFESANKSASVRVGI